MKILSLCMIVKNEEQVLGRCLDSVKNIFDEIIIVDTGSKDSTKEIAQKYTDNIFDFTWNDNFSEARNFSFLQSTSKYNMWLDADDIILEENRIKLIEFKKKLQDSEVNIYLLKYNTSFDQNNCPIFSYYRERIVESHNYWIDPIHEFIPITGKKEYLDLSIEHKSIKKIKTRRNLKIYEKMKKNKIIFSPRNLYYYGRELFDLNYYEKAIKVLDKFLKTEEGWMEDEIDACSLIYKCYDKLNQAKKGLPYLFQTFLYDVPRKKICCFIGNQFLNQKEYKKAIYWYQSTLALPQKFNNGFHEMDYDFFIPYINLCVCYDNLQMVVEAKYYHELSKKEKPNHPSVLRNDIYFENRNNF